MTTTLLLRYKGNEVLTSCWTAATKSDNTIMICYLWGADINIFNTTTTATARCALLRMTMEEFLTKIANGGIVDLR